MEKFSNSILALLIVFSMAQPAFADDNDEDDIEQISTIAHTFGLIPLEDAKSKALAAKPGVIKETELEKRKFRSGWDYEFEIVDADGKEWEICIDAKTGKVSSIHRDWF